jgi:hypothetical protein
MFPIGAECQSRISIEDLRLAIQKLDTVACKIGFTTSAIKLFFTPHSIQVSGCLAIERGIKRQFWMNPTIHARGNHKSGNKLTRATYYKIPNSV